MINRFIVACASLVRASLLVLCAVCSCVFAIVFVQVYVLVCVALLCAHQSASVCVGSLLVVGLRVRVRVLGLSGVWVLLV